MDRAWGGDKSVLLPGEVSVETLSVPMQVSSPHLFDEPLAEGSRDPLPGVDPTVHEDSRFGGAGRLTELSEKQS